MEPKHIDFFIFSNTSPIFKGISLIILGAISLLFCWWMVKKWKEPLSWQFKIYIGLSSFIFLYGLYILLLQPQWWTPPWW